MLSHDGSGGSGERTHRRAPWAFREQRVRRVLRAAPTAPTAVRVDRHRSGTAGAAAAPAVAGDGARRPGSGRCVKWGIGLSACC